MKGISNVNVCLTVNISAEVARVWETIGPFAGLADWHPAISEAAMESEGRRRRLKLVDGSEILEELVGHDDAGTSYTYRIVDAGPLPVRNYEATIFVTPGESGGCDVTWQGRFDPEGNETLAEQTMQRVYEAGLENLKKMFGAS